MPRTGKHGREVLPPGIIQSVEYLPNGKPRSERRVCWFYRFLETGDGTQSVKDAGYKVANPAREHLRLCHEMYPQLQQAAFYRQAMIQPLAFRFLEEAMILGLGEMKKEKPDARIIALGVKAAPEILDRGVMPKGLALKGLPMGDHEGVDPERDYRTALDAMVSSVGIEAVRHMPHIMEYRLYREYIEEKWPLKEVV